MRNLASVELQKGNRIMAISWLKGRPRLAIPTRDATHSSYKASTVKRTNDALTADYGPQATEYTKTGAPFAFLAVLDLTPHTSRLDLADSLWVDEWHDDSGRKRALTGLRVLGNVKSPSAQS